MLSEIVIGVIIAVLSAFIIYKLGFTNSHTKVTVHATRSNLKGWKTWIVIGWVIIFSGIYSFSTHTPELGIEDLRFGLGVSLVFFGVMAIVIGRLGVWWNRS